MYNDECKKRKGTRTPLEYYDILGFIIPAILNPNMINDPSILFLKYKNDACFICVFAIEQ